MSEPLKKVFTKAALDTVTLAIQISSGSGSTFTASWRVTELNEKYRANVLTLELDVTNPEQVKAAVNEAHAHFGRLDIVFNNAGCSLVGMIEIITHFYCTEIPIGEDTNR